MEEQIVSEIQKCAFLHSLLTLFPMDFAFVTDVDLKLSNFNLEVKGKDKYFAQKNSTTLMKCGLGGPWFFFFW